MIVIFFSYFSVINLILRIFIRFFSFTHSFVRFMFLHSFIQFIYCFRIMEAVAIELTAGSWDRISGGASVDRSMSVMDSLASVISQR